MQDKENVVLGKNPLLELLRHAPEKVETVFIQESRQKKVGEILSLCRENKIHYQMVPRVFLDKMGTGHQGLGARIFHIGYVYPQDLLQNVQSAKLPLILALDQLQDPGNIGVLARTLFALGGKGLVLTRHRSASLGPVAVKSSAGALKRIPVARVANLAKFLDEAEDNQWHIYGTGRTECSVNVFLQEIQHPLILVLGNEEKGLRPGVAKRCQSILSIPLASGFDSLNVAQAGAMIMGEILRRSF